MLDEQAASESQIEPPKPRVGIIASRCTISEYPSYLKHLLVGLADESVPAILVGPTMSNADSIVPPSIEVIRHPAIDMPFMQHYNLHQLLNKLIEFKPEVLHCLDETSAALVRWLARNLNIPYLLNVNSISARLPINSFSVTRCANIITPSKAIADHIAKSYPKFSDRIRQINVGTFVNESPACFAHPQRLPGIVVAPNIDNPSNLDNLFQSLHRLTIDGYQFIVAIIACGRIERQLWKQLRSFDLLHAVTIVPNALGLYSAGFAADIFIVPRPSGKFNMLLLTAMSAGSAVASSKEGGIDDLIIDNQTAYIFNPDDQLSVYNCLKSIFDRPDEARRLAESAQEYLRKNHQVSNMVSSTISLYRQAVILKEPVNA